MSCSCEQRGETQQIDTLQDVNATQIIYTEDEYLKIVSINQLQVTNLVIHRISTNNTVEIEDVPVPILETEILRYEVISTTTRNSRRIEDCNCRNGSHDRTVITAEIARFFNT